MKTGIFKMTALAIALFMLLSSCKKSGKEGADDNPGTPNTVTGRVVDAQGKPLQGVKVRAVNHTGYNMFAEGYTDANGKYSISISAVGGWNIYAWKEVDYKGQTYSLRMGMKNDADYSAFSTNGGSVTKDFVWKLTGRIVDRSLSPENGWGYFGGCLRFINDNGIVPAMAAGTKVTVTLTPVAGARYLDGTNATVAGKVTKAFVMAAGTTNYYITDVPVSEYRINIESELNGVKKEVYVGNSYTNLHQWVEFYFNTAGSSGSYESGVLTPNDNPFYMGQKN